MAKRSIKKQKATAKTESYGTTKPESCECEALQIIGVLVLIAGLLFGGYKLIKYLNAPKFKVGDCLVASRNFSYYKVEKYWSSLEEYELQPMKVHEGNLRNFLIEDRDKWTLDRSESYTEENFTKVPCG